MKQPKITIITVNYHKEDKTIKLIDSIKSSNYKNYKIIVIDSDSQGALKKLSKKFQELKIIYKKENTGWAKGLKIGVNSEKNTDYYLFLNNDQILDKNMISFLIQTAESDKDIGMVAPSVYSLNEPDKILTIGGYMNWFTGIAGESKRQKSQTIQEVDGYKEYVDDNALLIKKKAFMESGGHDLIYFLYYEDPDLNIAVKKAGYKILNNQRAKIYHEVYGSTEGKKSPIVVKHLIRNRFIFMRKHSSLFRFLIFLLLNLLIIIPVQFILLILKRHFDLIPSFLSGFFNGLKTSLTLKH